MEPTYASSDILLVSKVFYFFRNPQVHDIVVLKDPRDLRLVLKRITKIKDNTYFVVGDNEQESTDSRHYGWISKQEIVGKVFYKI